MSKQALLLVSALLFSAAVPPSPETRLKTKDQEKLGELIGEYFEAKRESTGLSEAKEEIREAIEKLEKKSKGVPVLAMVEDLEAAVYFAREYKSSVAKGRAQSFTYESAYDDAELEYVLHAPKSYRPSKGPYPVVILLPGAGEEPEPHLEEHWTDGDLRDSAILVACRMPDDKAAWNELQGAIGNALLTLRDVKATYAVDIDRVFIAGRGDSVETAVRTAEIFPHVFAGVIGRAGDMGDTSPVNFRNLPTFFAGGGSGCTAFQEKAKELGFENCTIAADAKEADISKWIAETERSAHPTEVSLAPASRTGGTAYWIQARGFDPDESPRLDASIDRETNRIEIDATDIGSIFVFFNDILVDMDKPIHVVANGVEHELQLSRSLESALDQAFSSGDAGRVYTNSYYFDLPARGGGEDGEAAGS